MCDRRHGHVSSARSAVAPPFGGRGRCGHVRLDSWETLARKGLTIFGSPMGGGERIERGEVEVWVNLALNSFECESDIVVGFVL